MLSKPTAPLPGGRGASRNRLHFCPGWVWYYRDHSNHAALSYHATDINIILDGMVYIILYHVVWCTLSHTTVTYGLVQIIIYHSYTMWSGPHYLIPQLYQVVWSKLSYITVIPCGLVQIIIFHSYTMWSGPHYLIPQLYHVIWSKLPYTTIVPCGLVLIII